MAEENSETGMKNSGGGKHDVFADISLKTMDGVRALWESQSVSCIIVSEQYESSETQIHSFPRSIPYRRDERLEKFLHFQKDRLVFPYSAEYVIYMESEYLVYIVIGFYAISGLLSLAFGYRLVRWLLSLYGVIIFGSMGGLLGALFVEHFVWILLCIAAGALIGGFIFYALFKVFMFLYAALLAGALTYALVTRMLDAPLDLVAALLAGALAGLLLLKVLRPVLILLTSLNGAIFLVTSVKVFLSKASMSQENFSPSAEVFGGSLVWIGLAALAGVLFQFATTKEESTPIYRKRKKKSSNEYTSPFAFLHDENRKKF